MYLLDKSSTLAIEPDLDVATSPFGKRAGWMVCAHTTPAKLAFVITAETTVVLDEVAVGKGDRLFLTYGCALPELSPDGMGFRISFLDRHQTTRTVFETVIEAGSAKDNWRRMALPLGEFAGESGRFILFCDPGPQGIPDADWLAVGEFAIARPDQIDRVRRNGQLEVGHFMAAENAKFVVPLVSIRKNSSAERQAGDYSNSVMLEHLAQTPIDFAAYVESFKPADVLRILCLLRDAGETEHHILQPVLTRAEITLSGPDTGLLDAAGKRFSNAARLEIARGRIADAVFPSGSFDLILCVSGLRHIVELESVSSILARSLKPDGELLVIQEYVGRSRGRLDAMANEIANHFFSLLPERLRINHRNYEKPRADTALANLDVSSAVNDSVPGQDIEQELAVDFRCKTAQRLSSFCWKLFDVYGRNFDTEQPLDRSLVEAAARLDAQHQIDGTLLPVNLDAIYRLRTAEDVDVQIPTHRHFVCNICGAFNVEPVESLTRETPSCAKCGSSIRLRTIVTMLSQYFFGRVMPIDDFPVHLEIKGCGTSDWEVYAAKLRRKFDYINTFYHQEPRLDIADISGHPIECFDFILSTDVFEHVLPPIQRAFDNAWTLLKPNGVFIFSVPFGLAENTVEHFPDIYDFEIVEENDKTILRNRTRQGETQVFDNLVFHGGIGKTLEMRLFSKNALIRHLAEAGFRKIAFCDMAIMSAGIYWQSELSVPLIAVK